MIAVVVAVLVVIALAAGALVGIGAAVRSLNRSGPADYVGDGYGSVVVQVAQGDTATAIGRTLRDAGVVQSVGAFTDAADSDAQSRGIAPGYYRLHRHMSGASALSLMLSPTSLVQSKVTVPEGYNVAQTVARIAADTTVPLSQLQRAARDPSAVGVPSYAHGSAEGFLFPATYVFGPHTTGGQALTAMTTRWQQAAADVNLAAGAKALGRSPYDVLIVASLLEREAKFPTDYGKTARVIYNRLAKGMKLQLDSTLVYALHKKGAYVSNADTRANTPYNTYLHTGLPPTPIDSPGEDALRAALHPTPGNWLYFVTLDKAGHNAYTADYQQFLRLKAEAARNGNVG